MQERVAEGGKCRNDIQVDVRGYQLIVLSIWKEVFRFNKSRQRWLLAAPLMLLFTYLAWISICTGISDFNSQKAQYLINSRIRAKQPVDFATLADARELLETAERWNAENSTAQENLALVQHMRATLPRISLAERDEALDSALAHILRAVQLRPTVGYTYSLVALIKQTRGERDAILRNALTRAVRYGPYEPTVQNTVIEVGSRAWAVLDNEERNTVRSVIRNAQLTRPEEARAMLMVKRWILPPCGELKVKIDGLCNSA